VGDFVPDFLFEPGLSPVEMMAWHELHVAGIRARLDPRWSRARILVDGIPEGFDLLVEEPCWTALATVGDVTVTILARSWRLDGLELVRVPDATAYVEGSRRHREERAREQRRERGA